MATEAPAAAAVTKRARDTGDPVDLGLIVLIAEDMVSDIVVRLADGGDDLIGKINAFESSSTTRPVDFERVERAIDKCIHRTGHSLRAGEHVVRIWHVYVAIADDSERSE